MMSVANNPAMAPNHHLVAWQHARVSGNPRLVFCVINSRGADQQPIRAEQRQRYLNRQSLCPFLFTLYDVIRPLRGSNI